MKFCPLTKGIQLYLRPLNRVVYCTVGSSTKVLEQSLKIRLTAGTDSAVITWVLFASVISIAKPSKWWRNSPVGIAWNVFLQALDLPQLLYAIIMISPWAAPCICHLLLLHTALASSHSNSNCCHSDTAELLVQQAAPADTICHSPLVLLYVPEAHAKHTEVPVERGCAMPTPHSISAFLPTLI